MRRTLKLAAILGAVALAALPLPPRIVERGYSRGVYPLVQPRLTALTNVTPFAWFDGVILAATVTTIVMWVVRLRRRREGLVRTLGRLAIDTGVIGAVLYLWFLATWGLNYRREPLSAQLDFREDRITLEALQEFAVRNTDALNALHARAHAGGWPDLQATVPVLEPAFLRTQRDLAMAWTAQAGRPKRTLLNFYFTRVSIDGMTDPFFLETLANQTLLPFERPATVAHEWSHLAGYADESEANFVGWLVCMRGPLPAQYSGWLSLYGTVMNALPRADRDRLARRLGPGPRDDLRAIAERIQRQAIPFASRVGYSLYDRYLKANRVEAGLRSYGEVVRLMLGTRFTEDGAPVLRN